MYLQRFLATTGKRFFAISAGGASGNFLHKSFNLTGQIGSVAKMATTTFVSKTVFLAGLLSLYSFRVVFRLLFQTSGLADHRDHRDHRDLKATLAQQEPLELREQRERQALLAHRDHKDLKAIRENQDLAFSQASWLLRLMTADG